MHRYRLERNKEVAEQHPSKCIYWSPKDREIDIDKVCITTTIIVAQSIINRIYSSFANSLLTLLFTSLERHCLESGRRQGSRRYCEFHLPSIEESVTYLESCNSNSESRVFGTAFLLKKLRELSTKPELFLCASSVAFYGNRNDMVITEALASNNQGYLTEVFEKTEKIVSGKRL